MDTIIIPINSWGNWGMDRMDNLPNVIDDGMDSSTAFCFLLSGWRLEAHLQTLLENVIWKLGAFTVPWLSPLKWESSQFLHRVINKAYLGNQHFCCCCCSLFFLKNSPHLFHRWSYPRTQHWVTWSAPETRSPGEFYFSSLFIFLVSYP